MKKPFIITFIVLLSVGAVIRTKMVSNSAVSALNSGGQRRNQLLPFNPNLRKLRIKKNRRLMALWMERKRNDIVPELITYLNDGDEEIRNRSVRDLGRLEDVRAEKYLQGKLDVSENNLKNRGVGKRNVQLPADPLYIKLALGRLRSRNFRGQKKLNMVASSIGLQWIDIVRLSKSVNDGKNYIRYTPGSQVLREFVDIIYGMAKEGEDVSPIVRQLDLAKGHRVILSAAKLKTDEEIYYLTDYLAKLKIVTPDAEDIIAHLVSFEPASGKAAYSYLRKMEKHRTDYPRNGFVNLLILIAYKSDSTSLLTLNNYSHSQNPAIRSYAISLKRQAESQSLPPFAF